MNTARIRKKRTPIETPTEDLLQRAPSIKENFGEVTTRRTMYFLLFLFPLLFGGVHATSYLPTYASLLFITAYVASVTTDTPFAPKSLNSRIGFILFSTIVYLGVLCLWGAFDTDPHPIIGEASGHVNQKGNMLAVVTLGTFASVWFLASRFCTTELRISSLFRLIALSGLLVSSVALFHWFYDNGKLFGIFEPNTIGYSNRARWPFVSSNNLGHYMLLTFFPALYLLVRDIRKLLGVHDSLASRRSVTLLDVINTSGVQPLIFTIAIDVITLFSISLALLGSQSRGSWFGIGIMLVVYVTMDRWLRKNDANPAVATQKTLRSKRSQARPLEGLTLFDSLVFIVRKFSLVFAIITSISLIYFYLQGRGLDMVLDRAEYGLLASKDDIRWVMYADTMQMIKEHPLFGVGLSGWDHMYARYASPELARLNPVYLHSDPLQLVAEVGIIGTIPFILLFWALFQGSVRTLIHSKNYTLRLKVLGAFCSLLGVLIASLFDFPYRIPSILFSTAILLGILTTAIDTAFEDSEKSLS